MAAATTGRRGRPFWCHQCNHPVNLEGDGIECPCCGGGFIEETSGGGDSPPAAAAAAAAAPAPPPPQHHHHHHHHQHPQRRSSSSPFFDLMNAMDSMASAMRQASIDGDGTDRTASAAQPYNGVLFVRGGAAGGGGGGGGAGGGGGWQVFNRGDLGGGGGGGGGQDFERLVQQLLQGAGAEGNYGTPPATRESIESVARVRISREHLQGDNAGCAVCKDDFALGSEVRQLPCAHLYHHDCIVPWLAIHGSCPVCRQEIGAAAAAGGAPGGDGPPPPSSSRFPWLRRNR